MPSRPCVIAERTARFLNKQQHSAEVFLTLDYDILSIICQDLDVKTLKSLTHLPGYWRWEAQRRLLQTVDYHAHTCTTKTNSRLDEGSLTLKCCTVERRQALYGDLQPTYIQDIRSFTTLLRNDKQLVKLVKHAFICRDADWIPETDHLIRTLQASGSLTRLHITGHLQPIPSFLNRRLPSTVIISMHIDFSIPSVARTIRPHNLLALFQLPSLSSLHISHFPFNHLPASTWLSLIAPATSSITSLTFTTGLPSPDALTTLLYWPRQLKSFETCLIPELDFDASGLTLPLLTSALIPHTSTLEHLSITSLRGHWDFGPTDTNVMAATTSFAEFRALKTLDIPFCALCNASLFNFLHDEIETFDSEYEELGPPKRVLPLGLEKLTLRVREAYLWSEHLGCQARFTKWLGALLELKGTVKADVNENSDGREENGRIVKRFEALREVKILRHNYTIEPLWVWRTVPCYSWFDPRLDYAVGESGWKEVSEYWAGRGVKLNFVMRDALEKREKTDRWTGEQEFEWYDL